VSWDGLLRGLKILLSVLLKYGVKGVTEGVKTVAPYIFILYKFLMWL